MLYKSLIFGVLFGIGIFAAKSGVGLFYLMERVSTRWGRPGRILVFLCLYGLVFACVALGLRRIDPLAHLEAIQVFLESGVQIHLLLASLMCVWGVLLLRRPHRHGDTGRGSLGWLLLVLPCPVCVSVIMLSMAFFLSLFPEHFFRVAVGLYLSFALISAAVTGLLFLFGRLTDQGADTLLGGAMVLLGVYFLLSMAILPQFAEVETIYRLASYRPPEHASQTVQYLVLAVLTLLPFLAGFGRTFKMIRSLS